MGGRAMMRGSGRGEDLEGVIATILLGRSHTAVQALPEGIFRPIGGIFGPPGGIFCPIGGIFSPPGGIFSPRWGIFGPFIVHH